MVLQVEKFIHDLIQISIKFQGNLQMKWTILLSLEARKLPEQRDTCCKQGCVRSRQQEVLASRSLP